METEFRRPRGLPIASTRSPCRNLSESPNGSTGSFSASILSSARSDSRSIPSTLASTGAARRPLRDPAARRRRRLGEHLHVDCALYDMRVGDDITGRIYDDTGPARLTPRNLVRNVSALVAGAVAVDDYLYHGGRNAIGQFPDRSAQLGERVLLRCGLATETIRTQERKRDKQRPATHDRSFILLHMCAGIRPAATFAPLCNFTVPKLISYAAVENNTVSAV